MPQVFQTPAPIHRPTRELDSCGASRSQLRVTESVPLFFRRFLRNETRASPKPVMIESYRSPTPPTPGEPKTNKVVGLNLHRHLLNLF